MNETPEQKADRTKIQQSLKSKFRDTMDDLTKRVKLCNDFMKTVKLEDFDDIDNVNGDPAARTYLYNEYTLMYTYIREENGETAGGGGQGGQGGPDSGGNKNSWVVPVIVVVASSGGGLLLISVIVVVICCVCRSASVSDDSESDGDVYTEEEHEVGRNAGQGWHGQGHHHGYQQHHWS